MTAEEAIKILKRDRDLCNFNPMTGELSPMNEDCKQSAIAYGVAISALEKQIAKKPLIVNVEFDDAITFECKDYLCPVCKCTLISKCDGEWCDGRKVAHCECGQAICWED